MAAYTSSLRPHALALSQVHEVDLETGKHSLVSSFVTSASNIVISSEKVSVSVLLY
jgi:hypothetical protein